MFNLEALIEAHWQWLFILLGCLFLFGAIFGWSFAIKPSRWEDDGFHFIPWRVKTGASGIVLIAGGILLLFYK